MMKRLLGEPLLHFLLLGAVLFAAHGVLSRGGASEPGRIIVTQGQIEGMAMLFARTWQRLPSDDELQGLIRNHVREEVLYREGVALGLDRDDPIVRRRVAQKLEFVAENGETAEPRDQDLQAYLDSHRAVFAVEPRFTFRHIYLDPRRHGQMLLADAERMLSELNSPESRLDAASLGDPTTLPLQFDDASASAVKNALGNEFVKSLAQLETGRWTGPLKSGYGMHLVQISKRQEPRTAALSEVREAVKREWELARRVETGDKFYQSLLQRYTVTVERPRLARDVGETGAKPQQ
jgi:hypothetical protein